MDFVLITGHATKPYLPFLNDLYLREERKHESLGFLPKQTYEREYVHDRIWIGLLNNQPCGFLYVGAAIAGQDRRIYQACIEFDLRRHLWGSTMIAEFCKVSASLGCRGISLRCGFDLQANDFWSKMGFYVYGYKAGGLRRGRILNLWRTDFTDSLIPFDHLRPMRGERDAKLWNKYKDQLSLTDTTRPTHSWDELKELLDLSDKTRRTL